MSIGLENLSLVRTRRLVLNQVDLALERGGITAICGPNGAGKSSLLQVLAGLLPPAAGHITLEGEALASIHPRERARRLAYLPQSGEVAWDVSVANLVALGRLPHRDRGEQAVARAMTACGLEDFAARRVSTLSGGEKGRALLARVLAGEPEWIFADEPLAALDLAHQFELLRVLRGEAKAGRGVVLVLHDLALAMNHADRVIVLREGRVVADGAPEKALSSQVIANGWGVEAQWVGERGAQAIVVEG